MGIAPLTLSSALKSIGVAQVFVGDPMHTGGGGMVNLGATEGAITFTPTETMNELTAPEYTGGVAHQATVVPGAITIAVPLIMGDATIFSKIMANGKKGDGFSSPQPVLPTTVLIIPITELGAGLAYAAGAWTPPGTLQNAIWLWRAFPTMGAMPFAYANGGKVITTVTFHGMFDASKPEGQKVYSIGDPTAATPPVTGILI